MISCEITIPDTDFSMRMEREMFQQIESTEEPEIELEIFSGSASGSDEYELCESSGDCGSGYPMDYEVVDENFSKVGLDRGTSEEVATYEGSSTQYLSANRILVLFLSTLCHRFVSL